MHRRASNPRFQAPTAPPHPIVRAVCNKTTGYTGKIIVVKMVAQALSMTQEHDPWATHIGVDE